MKSINEENVDVIFMDPPYNCGHEQKILKMLKNLSFVTEETLIIVEASLDTEFAWVSETGFTVEREKRYKTSKHVFLRRAV